MKRPIFGVVILLLSVFFLFLPVKVLAAVTFSLTPTTKTVSVNDSQETLIMLDTGGQTISGGSAVLIYDPSKLQVVDANSTLAGVQVGAGTIFTTPVTNFVDAVNGKITLDYGQTTGSFSGSGSFGKVSFKAVATGSAVVSFLLAASGTSTASAVYSGGSNILAAGNSAIYTISSSAVGVPSAITPTATPSSLPKSGAVENTILLFMLGILLLSTGFILAFTHSR